MGTVFIIIGVATIAAAVAALSLRNLVHCALALTLAFAGLAAAYLALDAQFVGFAQILVYVGAVAILVVFAILLTRGGDTPEQSVFSSSWAWGLIVAGIVLAVLVGAVLNSNALRRDTPATPSASVQQIGETLMTKFALPLEVIGLLLTAALIGAVIIAMQDSSKTRMDGSKGPSVRIQPPTSTGGHA